MVMNANELADELEQSALATHRSLEIATMLRQQQTKLEKLQGLLREYTALHMKQQAEIKDLKQQVAFLEDWRDTWSPFLKAITEKVNEK